VSTAIGSYATAAALKALLDTTVTSDDPLLALICDRVNQFIESETGRCLAPIASAAYVYDGDGSPSLYLPTPTGGELIGGIRAVTLVEIKLFTTDGWHTLASTEYFLRQQVGVTGPFERLLYTDYPQGISAVWPQGYGTVRVTGTAGWDAIPDDITELALLIAARAWNDRLTGIQDVMSGPRAEPVMSARYLSGRDRDTLRRYTVAEKLA
jgi:hypothetical protein